jgi:RNA polymerase sigma factor (sigma-70 family)
MRANAPPDVALSGTDENAIGAILAERARFHRFIAARVGNAATAEDLLQDSLLRALKQSRNLHRGEAAVPWFYRILRNAIADHFRKTGSENRRVTMLLTDMEARGDDVSTPPPDWDTAVCACFRGLLPALKPRYAEVIRRIDLLGESKADVARELEISHATMDVLLHRARQALRRRLEVFCGACSREHCLACLCKPPVRSFQTNDPQRNATRVGI